MTNVQLNRPNPSAVNISPSELTSESIKHDILDHLYYSQARLPEIATRNDWYMSLALTVRDRLLDHWIATARTVMKSDVRVVSYLSAEFLIGPQLGNNLINLGIYDQTRQATEELGLNLDSLLDQEEEPGLGNGGLGRLAACYLESLATLEVPASGSGIYAQTRQATEELGLNLDSLLDQEEEPGLGNGGLGRLAACYLESLATLEVPAIGYGIRYEFGIFDQEIKDGWQVEITDKWLSPGYPWEIRRPEISFDVNLGGHTQTDVDDKGNYRGRWLPHHVVKGVACDTPVVGYKVGTANLLRLWK